MSVAIRVDGVGKKYRVRQSNERYTALRDVIAGKVRDILRPRPSERRVAPDDFWALQDVSFDVAHSEVIGIIGRNGAGKSTLLKILSRITEPTRGRVELDGRVGSLLEVGTGFHPELTGRENIYLNGVILGMTRAEIRRKFDEIVAFAEVEQFLELPVKRYSSGMYVRLAFAVAAHLEPEILIVDEVLAVGDVAFQRKCLGKISEVAQGGRTVLFVSHNMGAIRRLTRRCVLLDHGQVQMVAPVEETIQAYLKQSAAGLTGGQFVRDTSHPEGRPFHVNRVITRRDGDPEPVNYFDCDESVLIEIEYSATRRVPGIYAYINLLRLDGTVVYEGDSRDPGDDPFEDLTAGDATLSIGIPARILAPGTYQVYLAFASRLDPAGPTIDLPGIVGEFVMDDTKTPRGNQRHGYLSTILKWERVAAPR